MFRLIAIALTSTFLLLALFGTSNNQGPLDSPVRVMGIMGQRTTGPQVADQPQFHYVNRHHQALKTAPDNSASILRILPYGAALEPMDEAPGDFTKVRDRYGRVGFIRSDVLSASFPG